MIERKFGDSVRSKGGLAMKNEVLAKLLCHNLCCLISVMYEMGVKAVFWVEQMRVGLDDAKAELRRWKKLTKMRAGENSTL
jgi:hypothetical protein